MGDCTRAFLYMLSVAVARSSSDDNAICYVLPVLWMTLFSHNGSQSATQLVTYRDSPGGAAKLRTRGEVCYRSLPHCLVYVWRHFCYHFYSAPQCSQCKHCTSYSNSVRLSICPSVRPSVCPSVTRRLCVKATVRSTVQFALSDSKMRLVFCKPKNIPEDDPFSIKSWLKLTDPSLQKALSFDTFCLVARQR